MIDVIPRRPNGSSRRQPEYTPITGPFFVRDREGRSNMKTLMQLLVFAAAAVLLVLAVTQVE